MNFRSFISFLKKHANLKNVAGILIVLFAVTGCSPQLATTAAKTVPHQGAWGIYALTLSTEDVTLIWSSSEAISFLALSKSGDKFAFSQKVGGTAEANEEIFVINNDGAGLTRLTNNNIWDLYPSFSSDDSKLAYLSMTGTTLDLYTVNSDGTNVQLLYDSGSHDADVNWGSGGRIAFTKDSQIWSLKSDGTEVRRVTDPVNAGQWGIANLPVGDYDPRFSPDSSRIVFSRMVDVNASVHGSYDLFAIAPDGSGETRLTTTGYAQGLANWSAAGDKLVFIVSAIGSEGKYDIYMMGSDGADLTNITPSYFPANFLCHSAMFSKDDSKVYFTGQWY